MIPTGEILLAKIALEQNLAPKDKLEYCLSLRKENQNGPSLDQIMVQMEVIRPDQIQQLRQITYQRISSQQPHARQDWEDNQLGRMALYYKMVEPPQLQSAWQKLRQYQSQGMLKRLGEVMVESRLITYEQWQKLEQMRRRQESQSGSSVQQPPSSMDHTPSPQGNRSGHRPSQTPDSRRPTNFQQPTSSQFQRPSSMDITPSPTPFSGIHSDSPTETLPQSGSGSSPNHNRRTRGGEEETPRNFGRYQIVGKIAKGGMGVVYKAKDNNLDRVVALKTLIGGTYASRETIQRFMVEAKAAAKLRHPHIVAIHEVGNYGGQYFFTMDYIEGLPFSHVIRQGIDEKRAVEVTIKITEAIQFAHSKGVIHRDLKPSNVIIDKSGDPQVMDFGLAKEVDSGEDITKTGATLGTPSYMSPEQAAGYTDQVDHLSDVYSLGAILYEALTGERPFTGESSMAIIYQVITNEPPAPRKVNPQVSKELETIILKAMDKEKSRRYPTAQELADDLRRYLQGETIQARPASLVYKLWKKVRRNKLASGITAACLVLVVVLSAVFLQSSRQQEVEKQKALLEQKQAKAQGLFKEGKREFENGRFFQAAKLLEQALEVDPKMVEGHLYLGKVFRENKDYEQGEKRFLKALELDERYSPALYELGLLEEGRANREKALDYYTRALEKNGDYKEALLRRAKLYESMGEMEKSFQDLQRLQKIKAAEGAEHLAKGRELFEKGNYIPAKYHLTLVLEGLPKEARAYALRAQCHSGLGDYEQAREDISKAVELDEKNHQYLLTRGDISLRFGRYRQALEDYEEVVQKRPDLGKPHVYMGTIYLRQHRYHNALEEYKKAYAKDYLQPELYLGMARVYLELRLWDKGLHYLNQIKSASDRGVEYYYTRGLLLYGQKNFQEGVEMLEKARQKSNLPSIYLELSRGYIALGKNVEASKVLEEVTERSYRYHYQKAQVTMAFENYPTAIDHINKAIQIAPQPPSHYYILRGEVCQKMERHQQAVNDFGVALETDWRNVVHFEKLLNAVMSGFLWDEATDRFAYQRDWLTAIPKRQWSFEANLFTPEEEELRQQYFRDSQIRGVHSQVGRVDEEKVRQAVDSLKSEIEDMRRVAEQYLVRLGKGVLEYLEGELKEARGRYRERLKRVVEKIRKKFEKKGLSRLLRYLVQIHIGQDIVARKRLYEYGKRRFPLLKKALLDDSLPHMLRLFAARELYDLTDRSSVDFLNGLLDKTGPVRVLAAIVVSESYRSTKKVERAFQQAVQSSDSLLASMALQRIQPTSRNRDHLKKLLQSRNYRLRLLAASRLFLDGYRPAMPILVKTTRAEEPNLRIFACQTLAKSQDSAVLSHLFGLLKDSDPEVRMAGVIALRYFEPSKTAKILLEMLNDKDYRVRLHTLILLERSKSTQALQRMLKVAMDQSETLYIRLIAIFSFRSIKNMAVAMSLFQFLPKLAKDKNHLIRALVTMLMGRMITHNKSKFDLGALVFPMVEKGLDDKHPFVKVSAMLAVAEVGSAKHRQKYMNYLTTAEPLVQAGAAAGLVQLLMKKKIEAPGLLDQLKNSPVELVRRGAAFGLRQVGKSRWLEKKPRSVQKQLRLRWFSLSQELYDKSYNTYIDLAEAHRDRKQHSQARVYLEKALRAAPRNLSVLEDSASIYISIGQRKKALALYDRWIELYPNDYRPYFYKGKNTRREEQNRNYRYALLVLKQPNGADEYLHKIEILQRFGLGKLAREALARGVRENGSETLYHLMIETLVNEKKFDRALATYQHYKAMVRKPSDQMIYLLGLCHYGTNRYKKAHNQFHQLWKCRDEGLRLRSIQMSARCYEGLGKSASAQKLLDFLVKSFPKSGEAHCALGRYFQRQGKYFDAYLKFREALKYEDYRQRALALLSLNCALRNKRSECVEFIRKAVQGGFSEFDWLRHQTGYQKARRIDGFRAVVESY